MTGDNSVNIFDLVYVSLRLDSGDISADIDGSGKVDFSDLILVVRNLGPTDCGGPPYINFVEPTPADGTKLGIGEDSVDVNVSVDKSGSAFIDWDNSLIAWFKFEGSVDDLSSYLNSVTVEGNPTYESGVKGQAINLNGDDYLNLGQENEFDVDYLTLAAWVNFAETPTNQSVIFSTDDGINRNWALYMYNENTLRFFIFYNGGTLQLRDYSFTPEVGTWYHLVAVANGTQIVIYIDGEKVIDRTYSGILDKAPVDLKIGKGRIANDNFNGLIDDVMIFNRSLSQEEINALYSVSESFYGNFSNLKNGTYGYKAYLIDNENNNYETETRTVIIDSIEDAGAPIVSLNSPLQGEEVTTAITTFDYIVEDDNDIKFCTLVIDGIDDKQDLTTTKNVSQIFMKSLVNGPHTYSVKCRDQFDTENILETRDFSVNIQCVDEDGDGYGVWPNSGKETGCVEDGFDCNDSEINIYLGATEICDGVDNSCLRGIDEGCSGSTTIDGWRVMPIRSQEEYNLGLVGGLGVQHNQGIARSLSNPDIIYLSHDVGQTWRSDDNGDSWKKTLSNGMYVWAGQSIEVDPDDSSIVYIIMDHSWDHLNTEYSGIYKSTNGGHSWELIYQTDSTTHSRRYEHNLAYDPTSSTGTGTTTWYAAFNNDGLYQSEDSGVSWNNVADLTGHSNIYSIKAHPTDGQTVYLATSNGLFSYDAISGLQTFGNLPAGSITSLEISSTDINTIYVTMADGLYKSTDGAIFAKIYDFSALYVFMNPGYPADLYLIGTTTSYHSSDAGENWNEINLTPAPGSLYFESTPKMLGLFTGIVPDPRCAGCAVGYTNATLWETTDGINFQSSNTLFTGVTPGWFKSMAFDRYNADRFFTFNNDVGTFVSYNKGDWFERRNSNAWQWYISGKVSWLGTYAGDIQPIDNSQKMVGAIGNYFDSKLMYSEDEGRNWEIVSDDSMNYMFVSYHDYIPYLVYAGDKISYDSGKTFDEIDFGSFSGEMPEIMGMCQANPDIVYAVSADEKSIYRSDDRGLSWSLYATSNYILRYVSDLIMFTIDPFDCDVIYTYDSTSYPGQPTSGDLARFDGETWENLGVLPLVGQTNPDNVVNSVVIDNAYPNIIYVSMHAPGKSQFFRSQDYGATWEDISYNYPRLGTNTLNINPHSGEVIIGSAIGTWALAPPYDTTNLIYDNLITVSCDIGTWDNHCEA